MGWIRARNYYFTATGSTTLSSQTINYNVQKGYLKDNINMKIKENRCNKSFLWIATASYLLFSVYIYYRFL